MSRPGVGGTDASSFRRVLDAVICSGCFDMAVGFRQSASPDRQPIAGAFPRVELVYTRDRLVLWDDGLPGFGGYYARIGGFGEQGEGRTIEQALERLACELRRHVDSWDVDVDEYARDAHRTERNTCAQEPKLITWARRAIQSRQLTEALKSATRDAVLEDE